MPARYRFEGKQQYYWPYPREITNAGGVKRFDEIMNTGDIILAEEGQIPKSMPFVRLDPPEPLAEPTNRLLLEKRSDGLYDVVNESTNVALNEIPLGYEEAFALAGNAGIVQGDQPTAARIYPGPRERSTESRVLPKFPTAEAQKEVVSRGGGWFDLIGADGKKLNDSGLRWEEACALAGRDPNDKLGA